MWKKINSQYILRKIIKEHLEEKKYLKLALYSKKLQKKLELSLNNYINLFYSLEIELTPIKGLKEDKNIFINIKNNYNFNIYFDNKKTEQNFLLKNVNDSINKIKIRIRYNRNDLNDLSELFYGCNSLIYINVEKLKTDNVNDMSNMFYECSSLKELNLNNFMTYNVDNMFEMFAYCSSLNKLEINNFKFNRNINCRFMFSHCSEELKLKIIEKYKNLPESTFWDYVEE